MIVPFGFYRKISYFIFRQWRLWRMFFPNLGSIHQIDESQPIKIMFVKTKSDIRNHRPIKMRCWDPAELLERLDLKQDSDKLECGWYWTGWTDIALPCVESFLKKLVKRDRKAVVHSNRVWIEVVCIDLIIVVIVFRFFRNKMFECVLLRNKRSGFPDPPSERKLIHIRILVLDIGRSKLLSETLVQTNSFLFIPICYVSLRNFIAGSFHDLFFNHIFENIYVYGFL